MGADGGSPPGVAGGSGRGGIGHGRRRGAPATLAPAARGTPPRVAVAADGPVTHGATAADTAAAAAPATAAAATVGPYPPPAGLRAGGLPLSHPLVPWASPLLRRALDAGVGAMAAACSERGLATAAAGPVAGAWAGVEAEAGGSFWEVCPAGWYVAAFSGLRLSVDGGNGAPDAIAAVVGATVDVRTAVDGVLRRSLAPMVTPAWAAIAWRYGVVASALTVSHQSPLTLSPWVTNWLAVAATVAMATVATGEGQGRGCGSALAAASAAAEGKRGHAGGGRARSSNGSGDGVGDGDEDDVGGGDNGVGDESNGDDGDGFCDADRGDDGAGSGSGGCAAGNDYVSPRSLPTCALVPPQ